MGASTEPSPPTVLIFSIYEAHSNQSRKTSRIQIRSAFCINYKSILSQCKAMKKDFVISRIEASQDGSPYVYVSLNDPDDYKAGAGFVNTSTIYRWNVGIFLQTPQQVIN